MGDLIYKTEKDEHLTEYMKAYFQNDFIFSFYTLKNP